MSANTSQMPRPNTTLTSGVTAGQLRRIAHQHELDDQPRQIGDRRAHDELRIVGAHDLERGVHELGRPSAALGGVRAFGGEGSACGARTRCRSRGSRASAVALRAETRRRESAEPLPGRSCWRTKADADPRELQCRIAPGRRSRGWREECAGVWLDPESCSPQSPRRSQRCPVPSAKRTGAGSAVSPTAPPPRRAACAGAGSPRPAPAPRAPARAGSGDSACRRSRRAGGSA